MGNISEFCAEGASYNEEMISVSSDVSLRVFTFTPAVQGKNPVVVFVAGWISLMSGWGRVLREMTKDFQVYYIETREKISSRVQGKVEYSAETIGQDIVSLISHFDLKNQDYILFGSSLGATAILDCCRFLKSIPLCLVLVGPNAEFRVPKIWKGVVRLFYPPLYQLVKPSVKWHLRTFRMNVDSDPAQYQKYCTALDSADPRKLKKAAMSLWNYKVWDLLEDIEYPTLIIGASKDKLHEPENLGKMVSMMKHATYLDLGTNQLTHSEGMVEAMRHYISQL